MSGAVLDIASVKAQRILVIAPHPDDESLGCGGLIALLARLGRAFHVVFVTDGGASHPGSKLWPRERLAAERKREAALALDHLGIDDHGRSFLGLQDAGMPDPETPEGRTAVVALAEIVEDFAPDLALLPWRRDPHRDHRDAWALAHTAFATAGSRPEILEYAIWLDELGVAGDRPASEEAIPLSLDITDVVDAKRAAVAAHLSQTSHLVDDDPGGFRLTPATIERLTGPLERYWRPL